MHDDRRMLEVPEEAGWQLGVFTGRQAAVAGWTSMQLRYAVHCGRLIRLRRGTYALAPTSELAAGTQQLLLAQAGIATALQVSRATVSHAAAVAVHGLPLLQIPSRPCLTLPSEFRTRDAGVHLHRQPIPDWARDRSRRFSLTSEARSCVDLCREAGLAAALVAADAALHRGSCSIDALSEVYDHCKGRAGLPSGRQLLELVDGRSESPLESISRLAMRAVRPQPRPQVELRAANGRFLARVDFYWDDAGLVGEADGRRKYTDDALWREKIRQDSLTEHGLVVERWGWTVATRPGALQARIEDALIRAHRLRAAGIGNTANALCGPNR